jgi:hypothetical protein
MKSSKALNGIDLHAVLKPVSRSYTNGLESLSRSTALRSSQSLEAHQSLGFAKNRGSTSLTGIGIHLVRLIIPSQPQ